MQSTTFTNNGLNNGFNKMNLNNTTPITNNIITPIVSETILEAPVIRETIKPEEKINIQENVERTIHQTEVKKVIQPIIEKEVAPTQIHHNTLAVKHNTIVQSTEKDLDLHLKTGISELQSTKTIAPTVELGTTTKGPIVHEHLEKKIIEQIQPIIYKEVVQPHIIETIQPITEVIYAAPTLSTQIEVREPIFYNSTSSFTPVAPIVAPITPIVTPIAPIATPIAPISKPISTIPVAPVAPAVYQPKQHKHRGLFSKLHRKHTTPVVAPVAPIAPVAAVAPISGPVVTPVVHDASYGLPVAHNPITPGMPGSAFNPAVRNLDHIPSSDPALVQGRANLHPTSVNAAPLPTLGLNNSFAPVVNPMVNSQLTKGLVGVPATTSSIGRQQINPTVL